MILPASLVPNFTGLVDARCSGTLAQRASLATPIAAGLTYFATDNKKLYLWDGTEWRCLAFESESSAEEPSTPPSSGPTAAYDFDFASATSWTGTVLTFPDSSTATANNSSLSWSATDGITTPAGGHLDIGDLTFGGEFSIEVYFKFNQVASFNRVVAFYNSTGDGIGLVRENTTNNLRFFNDGPFGYNRYVTSTATPELGTFAFVHVVAVCGTGGASSVYVNGSLLSGAALAGSTPTAPSTQNRTSNVIGRDAWGDSGNETVKFLRVYTSALTTAQVQDLYDAV